jgi:excisionase family DNA binding protein
MLLSVPELAKRLSIAESRARALVVSGRIPGQRVGGRWVIDESDAANYRKAAPGRPLSERGAWEFIWALQSPSLTPGRDQDAVKRHRLKDRIRRFHESEHPVSSLISLLARRADRVQMSASASDLPGLREDPRLRLSGVAHPDSGLMVAAEVEAYVARHDLSDLIKDWFLVTAKPGTRPNVTIHAANLVPYEIPSIAVAADLAEYPGQREQQAAAEIIRRLRSP